MALVQKAGLAEHPAILRQSQSDCMQRVESSFTLVWRSDLLNGACLLSGKSKET